MGKSFEFFCVLIYLLFSNSVPEETDVDSSSNDSAAQSKKLRLSDIGPSSMIPPQSSKRELEIKSSDVRSWSSFVRSPLSRTTQTAQLHNDDDVQLLEEVTQSASRFGDNLPITKETKKSPTEDLPMKDHPKENSKCIPLLATSDAGVFDNISSISQLEKFMTTRLGPVLNSTPLGNGSKTNQFQKHNRSSTNSNAFRFDRRSVKLNNDQSKRVLNGGIQKPAYKPLHYKLYGSPKSQKKALITSVLSNQSQNWAIRSCFRMDEKLSYKNLLSQFTPKGVASKISPATPSLGSSSQSSVILVEKIATREALSVEKELKRSNSILIDLEREISTVDKVKDVERTPVSIQSKAVSRVNTLEEALALSPVYESKFLSNFKSRFTAKERERQRQVDLEEIRSKIHADNRKEWENSVEERLRKVLEITSRCVIDERAEVAVILPELTDEMELVIEGAMRPHPDSEVLCDAFNLTITRRDINSLSALNWLNDQVINFYFTLIMERSKSGDLPKVYAFNTFFYPKLMSGGHSVLKRWTRKVDLFEHDYILIPVHLGLHWCVAVIAAKEQSVRYYDSMGGRNNDCLKALITYLEAESLDKRKTVLDSSSWTMECMEDIPQQMNGSDCGMFACKYAEYISRKARITFQQKDMPYFRRRMVYEIVQQKLIHP